VPVSQDFSSNISVLALKNNWSWAPNLCCSSATLTMFSWTSALSALQQQKKRGTPSKMPWWSFLYSWFCRHRFHFSLSLWNLLEVSHEPWELHFIIFTVAAIVAIKCHHQLSSPNLSSLSAFHFVSSPVTMDYSWVHPLLWIIYAPVPSWKGDDYIKDSTNRDGYRYRSAT